MKIQINFSETSFAPIVQSSKLPPNAENFVEYQLAKPSQSEKELAWIDTFDAVLSEILSPRF